MKKEILLLGLLILALVDICLYWNGHLYSRAKEKIEGNEAKIKNLEEANQFYPFNDGVYYELGKAYFDQAISNLGNIELRNDYLQKSSLNFSRSLRINPTSLFAHFNFAQSLLYMSYLSFPSDVNCYEEYRKAALLTGHNSQIFYEVGKILFSRWSFLSEDERNFATEILMKILLGRDREKLEAIFQVWDMNVRDYAVMEKILPRDASAFRSYAQFLGEKSLSLEERQKTLARAELFDLERAKNEYSLGQREFQLFHLKEALGHFLSSLEIVKGINFYQALSKEKLIDFREFKDIKKSIYLSLAKCGIEETRKLKDAENYLRSYLALEDQVGRIGELESFLQERSLIPSRQVALDSKRLALLPFQLLLDFKQNRYSEIAKLGNLFQQSIVIFPDSQKKSYVEFLQLVGDSFQKLDYIYESENFYQRALEMDPDNLETLLKMAKNYDRLNDQDKLRKVKGKIENLLTPRELIFADLLINKGQAFSHPLILDGRKVYLNFHFSNSEESVLPLISVFFNDQVVWEDYLKDEVISFPGNSEVGKNTIRIIPLNRAISLKKISYLLE